MRLIKRSLLTFGLVFIVVGVLFMISHWPYQNQIFLTGFILLYAYCLLFFIQLIKKHNVRILLAGDISGLITTTLYFVGISINLLQIEYKLIFSWIFIISLVVFISILFYIVIKRDENSRFRITWLIISTVLLFIIGYITIHETVSDIRNVFVEINDEITEVSEKEKIEIDRLLMDLDTTHHNYNKISCIVQKMDSLNEQIHNLKVSLLESSINSGQAINDSIYKEKLSLILHLKYKISNYHDFLIANIDNKRLQDKIRDALNTDENVNNISWEENHFKHLPMSGLITILSGLQININSVSNDAIYYLKEIDNKE